MKTSSLKTKQTTAQIYADSASSAFLRLPPCSKSNGQAGTWLESQLPFSIILIPKFRHSTLTPFSSSMRIPCSSASIFKEVVKNFSKISELKS